MNPNQNKIHKIQKHLNQIQILLNQLTADQKLPDPQDPAWPTYREPHPVIKAHQTLKILQQHNLDPNHKTLIVTNELQDPLNQHYKIINQESTAILPDQLSEQQSTYSQIILNDILEHQPNPKQTLQKSKELLVTQETQPTPTITIIHHPYTAPDGAHNNCPKIYNHLALTPQQQNQHDIITDIYTCKTINPKAYLKKLLRQSNLLLEEETIITAPELTPYIKQKLLPHIVKNTWNNKITKQKAQQIMLIQSIIITARLIDNTN